MASNANEKDTARPRFYNDAIQNMVLSEKEGRPIYEDKEMLEIRIPGDKLFSFITVVRDLDKQRWPEIYAAFKRGEQRASVGTPLEHWPNPVMNKSRVAELKAQNIFSVEELSSIPDSVLPKMGMGARELRDQARAYIATAKEGAVTAKMAAEIARLEDMIKAMSVQSPKVQEPAEIQNEKPIEECTDDELKAFIKREAGKAPAGRVKRETLLRRAHELAKAA